MISANNVTYRVGKKALFEDVNIKFTEGNCYGLIGATGAGKSTLLSIIAGLQKPDYGKVLLGKNPVDIFSLNDKELSAFRNQNIGFISQEQSFLENFSVLDNVRLPAFICQKKIDDKTAAAVTERALTLLESLGISQLANSFPRELSGGENHRVLIARALMNDPQIILADEPTDSVDSERTEEIIKIFRRLADDGKTILIASHDKEALKLCDISVTVPAANLQ